jgi:hypothetical protein
MSTFNKVEWPIGPGPRPHSRRLSLPTLGLRVSERKLLLITVDVLLMNVALVVSLLARTDLPVH